MTKETKSLSYAELAVDLQAVKAKGFTQIAPSFVELKDTTSPETQATSKGIFTRISDNYSSGSGGWFLYLLDTDKGRLTIKEEDLMRCAPGTPIFVKMIGTTLSKTGRPQKELSYRF
jgi:hypothetical protein